MVDKLFVATKGLIFHAGKVLVVRESSAYKDSTQMGKFDVIGGRLDPGEQVEESLIREAKEETGLAITIGKPFFVNEVRPTVRGDAWQIIRIFYICSTQSFDAVLSQDHDEYKWIDPKKYKEENVIENLYPVFERFLDE